MTDQINYENSKNQDFIQDILESAIQNKILYVHFESTTENNVEEITLKSKEFNQDEKESISRNLLCYDASDIADTEYLPFLNNLLSSEKVLSLEPNKIYIEVTKPLNLGGFNSALEGFQKERLEVIQIAREIPLKKQAA